MLVANWMTKDPITVLPTTSLAKCQKLLKTHGIRRLPVVDEDNHVVGIISDRDVKSASPSKATSLEVHEMQYLLAEVKAKDIMTPRPVTVRPGNTVSEAALLMLRHHFGGLPVVDDANRVIGIITDQDIFKVLVTISGADMPGVEFTIETSNERGSLASIFELLRTKGARIVSVMTAYADDGTRQVFFRICEPTTREAEDALRAALEEKVKVVEWSERS